MKFKSEKSLRRAKKAFSLIELMIVIVIIGALTAIILPQFDVSEAEAKDTGCDASNYGTLSQLSKFRSLNGAFPSRMHTGYEATSSTAANTTLMGTITPDTIVTGDSPAAGTNNTAKIPSYTAYNMAGNTVAVNVGYGTAYVDSLKAAGIVSLAYGGFPADTSKASPHVAFLSLFKSDAVANVRAISDNWYEAWALSTTSGLPDENEGLDDGTNSAPITINGIPLPYYMFSNPRVAYAAKTTLPGVSSTTDAFDSTNDSDATKAADGIVVPLFVAPTVDWKHWYDEDGNANDSKIQVAQVGQCPWLEGGAEFRFYMAIFKIYNDGTKAKLLGTMCPEGGSLNP